MPTSVVLRFGATIGAVERTGVERMVARVFAPLVSEAGVPADLALTLFYDTDVELLAQEFAARTGNTVEFSRQVWAQSTGVAGSGWLMINPASPSWAPAPESQRAKIMAHELYHVAQHAWIGGDLTGNLGDAAVPRGGPRWLLEGSAELVGYRATASAGLLDFASAYADQVSRAKGTSAPLRDLEVLAGMTSAGAAAYPLSLVAVEFLTRERGLASLGAYWRAIANGKTWQQAFEAEFGRSIDTFYGQFESYRGSL